MRYTYSYYIVVSSYNMHKTIVCWAFESHENQLIVWTTLVKKVFIIFHSACLYFFRCYILIVVHMLTLIVQCTSNSYPTNTDRLQQELVQCSVNVAENIECIENVSDGLQTVVDYTELVSFVPCSRLKCHNVSSSLMMSILRSFCKLGLGWQVKFLMTKVCLNLSMRLTV